MNITTQNKIAWTPDVDATHYHLKLVNPGEAPTVVAVVTILDHTTVLGAETLPDGRLAIPASALLSGATVGNSYDIYIRGVNADGAGPYSAPLNVDFVVPIDAVTDLAVI
jgi:hypothetical protein